jgi:hypothetical protein
MSAATTRPRGLPQRLPEGETLLWQGAPDCRALMRHAFHVRGLSLYFTAIILWCVLAALQAGTPAAEIAVATLHKIGLALVPIALIALYAWAIQRSTTYSITNRRVVITCGIAVPMSFNIPFALIQGAGLRAYANGSGDLPLQLSEPEKLSYFVMWPHARPWRMARTEPMLRCVPDVAAASAVLARALAAHAQTAPVPAAARRAIRLGVPAGPRGQMVAAE